jgi:hypothetical protein
MPSRRRLLQAAVWAAAVGAGSGVEKALFGPFVQKREPPLMLFGLCDGERARGHLLVIITRRDSSSVHRPREHRGEHLDAVAHAGKN